MPLNSKRRRQDGAWYGAPMAYGNKQPMAMGYVIQQVQNFVASPAFLNQGTGIPECGGMSYSFRAHQPTFISPLSEAATMRVGYMQGIGANMVVTPSMTGQAVLEANPDIETAFERFKYGVVKSASIVVNATPIRKSSYNQGDVPLISGTNYNPRTRVVLSQSRTPLVHGNTVQKVLQAGGFEASSSTRTISRYRFTRTSCTKNFNVGRETTARLQMSYEPENLYLINDLRDNLPQFRFSTNGNPEYDPESNTDTAVTNKGYFTLSLVPDRPMIEAGGTPPKCFMGAPLCHNINIKFVYNVVFYTDEITTIQSAMPAAAGSTSTVFGRTADQWYNWIADKAQQGMDYLNGRLVAEINRYITYVDEPHEQIQLAFRAYERIVQFLANPENAQQALMAGVTGALAMQARGAIAAP